MAVLVAGPASKPTVIDRRRVELADPAVPQSTQPFHAGLDLPKAASAKTVARLVKCVEQYSARTIAELIRDCARGHRLVGAGIVAGSIVDPHTIANDHIRAHAEEGRLFRVVIESALKRARLKSSVTPEKELLNKSTRVLGISERTLKLNLVAMGKALDGSWRAEEKVATLAAWMILKEREK
jgi:hypothetical protein